MSYKKAITILMGLETVAEYRDIVIKLAQQHPSILVSLAIGEEKKKKVVEFSDNVRMTAAFLYNNPVFTIDCIKYIRNTFGFSLKEAKDVFDYVKSGARNEKFLSHLDRVVDIGMELHECYMTYYRHS